MRRLLVLVSAGALAVSCAAPNEAETTAAPQPPIETTPSDDAARKPRAPRGPRGESAPDFTVTTFSGERFSLGEQRGTPVVLNFWESW